MLVGIEGTKDYEGFHNCWINLTAENQEDEETLLVLSNYAIKQDARERVGVGGAQLSEDGKSLKFSITREWRSEYPQKLTPNGWVIAGELVRQ